MTPTNLTELVAELRELLDDVKLWPNSESRRFGLYRAAVNALPELLDEMERLQLSEEAVTWNRDELQGDVKQLQAENSRLRAALDSADSALLCGQDDYRKNRCGAFGTPGDRLLRATEDAREWLMKARRALEKGGEL